MKSLSQYLFISLLLVTGAHSETIVEFGEIRTFYGPDDLNLDPEKIVVAIDVYGMKIVPSMEYYLKRISKAPAMLM